MFTFTISTGSLDLLNAFPAHFSRMRNRAFKRVRRRIGTSWGKGERTSNEVRYDGHLLLQLVFTDRHDWQHYLPHPMGRL